MKLVLFLIAALLVATITPAFDCIDFTCDSACCVHELVMQKAQAPAILPAISASTHIVFMQPVVESAPIFFATVVPTANPPLRI